MLGEEKLNDHWLHSPDGKHERGKLIDVLLVVYKLKEIFRRGNGGNGMAEEKYGHFVPRDKQGKILLTVSFCGEFPI